MATVYLADNYKDPMPEAPGVGLVICREFLFTLSAAFIINDTVKLAKMAKGLGIVLDGWMLDVPDLDSGTAIELQLGDTDTAAKFMAANTVGQAAGIRFSQSHGVVAALPVSYAAGAEKDLILKVSTAPTTGATSGTIKGWLKYHFPGIASPV